MKDTLTTIVTGAAGAGMSAATDIVTPAQNSDYIQLAIGVMTLISLIIQTFFKRKKNVETPE